MQLRLISGDDVRRLLPMEQAISLMRDAFAAISNGTAFVPVRTHVSSDATGCRTLVMPSFVAGGKHMGIKLVSVQPSNPDRGLPTVHGLMTLIDADTGEPIALIDAESLTAIRTGAASGLATELLGSPSATTVAVFGAGVQAATQLEAVCTVRPIRRAFVFGRSVDGASKFARVMSERLDIDVTMETNHRLLRRTEVVCTATSASRPLFEPEALSNGIHINAVGSFRPHMAEVPPGTVRNAALIVDQREACLAEAGDILQSFASHEAAAAHIEAELGELVLGKHAGRRSPDQITLFKSVGIAVQDLVAATFVAERAAEEEQGRLLSL